MNGSVITRHLHRVRLRWKARRQRPEDGSILAMTCIFMTMFLALAGLVADGGHYFDAKQAAASEAEQAARAGAGSLDVSALHAGTVALDPNTAVSHGRELHGRLRPAGHRLGGGQHRLRPDQLPAADPAARHHRRRELPDQRDRIRHRRQWRHHGRMTMSTTTQAVARPKIRQLVEGLGALVVLVGGLVGIPAVLAVTVGWPLPHHLPRQCQVAGALRTPIPGSFWPHLFASLAWLAWAYFAFSVATIA